GRLHQWRDGGAGRRLASAQFRRRGPAAMDRGAVGETTRGADKKLRRAFGGAAQHRPRAAALTAFPNRRFPAIHLAAEAGGAGPLQVTMMGEPDLIMARQILTSLLAGALLCAGANLALAQGAAPPAPKAAKKDAAPKPPAAAAPAAAAAAAGGVEPQ